MLAADDYGSITGFRWLQNNVLIVGSVRMSEELAPGAAAGEYGSSSRATQGTCRALARTAWPGLTRPEARPGHLYIDNWPDEWVFVEGSR